MWSIDSRGATPLWRPVRRDPASILAFTTRHGGVSEAPFDTLNLGRSTDDRAAAVEDNRRRVLATLALDPDRLATAGQVHGEAIVEVGEPGLHRNADALLTRVPGLALAVTAADCVPILIEAPGVVCAVHAGWRGIAADLPGLAVRATGAAATGGGPVTVHIGPSIRDCCYEVGDEVAARFPVVARQHGGDRIRLDLVTAIRVQMRAARVPEERIHVIAACTSCDPFGYFSHRRDAGRTGRQWAVAALPERVTTRECAPV